MRLTNEQRQIIREEIARVFGDDTVVRLFGSRLDDHALGGDIDLYVEADGNAGDILDRELQLGVRLQRRLGDRKIDIIVHQRDKPLRPIDRHARETGVAL